VLTVLLIGFFLWRMILAERRRPGRLKEGIV
jgi:hypothetical protein